MAGDPKKRVSLPMVGQPRRAVDDVDLGDHLPKARAPGAWILLGGLSVFAVLMPLMYLAIALIGAIYRAPVGAPQTVLPAGVAGAIVVAVSATCGGFIVGRFGGKAGPREGALAGLLTGLVLWALTRMPIGAVVLALTVPFAFVGARWGRRTRKPGDSIGA
ncbi:MAG: hypothetical protein HYV09_20395 [Deltaproteobacteria bacterium]|nr:hypothetical protein [Deltaproteobacteria bacterium]